MTKADLVEQVASAMCYPSVTGLSLGLEAQQREVIFRFERAHPVLKIRFPVVVGLQFLPVPLGETGEVQGAVPVGSQQWAGGIHEWLHLPASGLSSGVGPGYAVRLPLPVLLVVETGGVEHA